MDAEKLRPGEIFVSDGKLYVKTEVISDVWGNPYDLVCLTTGEHNHSELGFPSPRKATLDDIKQLIKEL